MKTNKMHVLWGGRRGVNHRTDGVRGINHLRPPVVLRTVILRNVYLQLFTVQRTLRRIRDAVNSRAESNGETG